jgi:hypothetical protein
MKKYFSCLTLFFYTVITLFGINSQVANAQPSLGKSYYEDLQQQVQATVRALFPQLQLKTNLNGGILQVLVRDRDGVFKKAEIDFGGESLGITIGDIHFPYELFHTGAMALSERFAGRLSEGLGKLALDPEFKSVAMSAALAMLPSLQSLGLNTSSATPPSNSFFSMLKQIFFTEAFADPVSIGIVIVLIALAATIISIDFYTIIHCHAVLKEKTSAEANAEEVQYCEKMTEVRTCDYCP